MLGNVINLFSFIGVFLFSTLLFFSDSLVLSWLCLELATLSLVPSFFISGTAYSLSSLFSYLIVSGMSSGLIILGLIFSDLFIFLFIGFFIKFGVFPFTGWVYSVVTGSNWLVVYLFSIFLKSSFLILAFFFGPTPTSVFLFSTLCGATLLLLSSLFWLYSSSWFHCWCHMMLSSSCVLLMMCVWTSVDSLLWLYFGYFLWGSLCVLFFYCYGSHPLPQGIFVSLCYIWLLLTTPISLSLLYKLLMGFNIFSCSGFIFFLWIIYSLSEQFYLFSYLCSLFIPKKLGGLCSLI